jgi:CheY-like chemotaxis protein
VGSIFQASFLLEKEDVLQSSNPLPASSQIIEKQFDVQALKTTIQEADRQQLETCLRHFQEMNEQGDGFAFSQKKILVIDDESYNCQALLQMMKALKLPNVKDVVHTAYSGKQALKKVEQSLRWEETTDAEGRTRRRRVTEYGLILTDCSMPRMDGYECARLTLRTLRQNQVAPEDTPIIYAVTGHVELEYKMQAIESGMKNVYQKPLPIDAL